MRIHGVRRITDNYQTTTLESGERVPIDAAPEREYVARLLAEGLYGGVEAPHAVKECFAVRGHSPSGGGDTFIIVAIVGRKVLKLVSRRIFHQSMRFE